MKTDKPQVNSGKTRGNRLKKDGESWMDYRTGKKVVKEQPGE